MTLSFMVSLLLQASLAAVAAVAAENQQCLSIGSPQQQHQLEALRNRRHLLFSQAPAECTEAVIRTWLSQFGPVEQLQMYGEGGAVLGSNCGLVTMGTSEAAAAVVAAVLGNMQLPAAFQKLSVNWVVQSEDSGTQLSDGHAMPGSLAASADRTVRPCPHFICFTLSALQHADTARTLRLARSGWQATVEEEVS
jgi:hypothetical protein